MSDDLFRDDAGELVPVDAEGSAASLSTEPIDRVRLEGLAQELLELKLVFLSNTDNASRDIDQLRQLVNWLVILLGIVAVAFGGTLAWLAYSLKSDQSELTRQVESMAAGNIAVERVDQLEDQIGQVEQLTERVDALSSSQTAQLEEFDDQLAKVTSSVNTRRQTIAILADALQDLINEEEASGLSASPSGSEGEASEAASADTAEEVNAVGDDGNPSAEADADTEEGPE